MKFKIPDPFISFHPFARTLGRYIADRPEQCRFYQLWGACKYFVMVLCLMEIRELLSSPISSVKGMDDEREFRNSGDTIHNYHRVAPVLEPVRLLPQEGARIILLKKCLSVVYLTNRYSASP
jgi:hypothetical protein